MVAQKYRWDFIGLSTDNKPTPETSEKVVDGSTYYCADNSKLYVWCDNNWYERKPLGGGGGTSDFDELTNRPKYNGGSMTGETDIPASPSVVQTTGNSTTDVMSQDATTKMVYGGTTPSSLEDVQIGYNASSYYGSIAIGKSSNAGGNGYPTISIGESSRSRAEHQISIGYYAGKNATASHRGSISIGFNSNAKGIGAVALGARSEATQQGEMNIGSTTTDFGYNSSNYRLLTGLYDGQSAHDAVTVGQVNSVIDAINTALSTNIPHIGA